MSNPLKLAVFTLIGFVLGGFADYSFNAVLRWRAQEQELRTAKATLEELGVKQTKPKEFQVTKAEIAILHRKGFIFLDERGNVLAIKKEEP